jgi:hypothetical protein
MIFKQFPSEKIPSLSLAESRKETTGEKFEQLRIYKENGRYHLGKNLCGICSKSFSDTSNLAKHRLLHLGVIKCMFCNKVFSSRKDLRRHQNSRNCGSEEKRATFLKKQTQKSR